MTTKKIKYINNKYPNSKLPRISQVLIAKNEEKNIRRCLKWAKDITIEQIVVDTGSTDGTVKIAKSMGARIEYFKWCDDFAAAKNYALDLVSDLAEWVLFLDADEFIDGKDVDDLTYLLDCLNNRDEYKDYYSIQLPLNSFETKEAFDFWTRNHFVMPKDINIHTQIRIFRHNKNIRWRNKVHEILIFPDNKLIFNTDRIVIWHTGYMDDLNKKKIDRNKKILEEALKKYEKNNGLRDSKWFATLLYLGSSFPIEDFDNSAKEEISQLIVESSKEDYAEEILRQVFFENKVIETYHFLIWSAKRKREDEVVEKLVIEVFDRFGLEEDNKIPHNRNAIYLMAVYCFEDICSVETDGEENEIYNEKFDAEFVIWLLQTVLEMGERGEKEEFFIDDLVSENWVGICAMLIKLYEMLEEYENVEIYAKQLVEIDANDVGNLTAWVRVMKMNGKEVDEVIGELRSIFRGENWEVNKGVLVGLVREYFEDNGELEELGMS